MEIGLTTSDAKKLLSEHGLNEINTEKKNSPIKLFLSQFPTFINIILAVAAIVTLFISHYIDGIFILTVIVLNGVLGFIQEYRAEKSLEKLKSYSTPDVRVIRDGKETEVLATQIVPGDIVILSEGTRIPADGIMLTSHHLEIDEAILTGESLPVIKKQNEEVFQGTLVTKGRGTIKVTKTGLKTRFGQIAASLATIETEKTPLQKQINTLGKALALIALLLASLIIPVGFFQGLDLLTIFLTSATIGIAAIPEGLPAVITIALAIGTNRMAKQHAIARKMSAIETLGAISYLLVDKTGTLTQNKMQVKKVWTQDEKNIPKLMQAAVLGNTASLAPKGDGKSYDILGDSTDGALLLWVKTSDNPIETTIQNGKVIDEYVFDTKTKTVTTVWEHAKKNHVFVRGAPEAILANSTLSEENRQRIEQEFEVYAKEGLRVIAFGTKIDSPHTKKDRASLESDLTFLGFVGMYDPPRHEVSKAIALARNAGIQTIMVTGDNELTALAIAQEIGLIKESEEVITGSDLEAMTDGELSDKITKIRVFARTKPEDKLRITTVLENKGYIVGVTGDGVNDSLALKKAAVGMAMGESGTDVAKEASDIILADDNFATIVKAVEEGRTIYQNIAKSVMYLLSGNLSLITLVLIAVWVGLPIPLIPTQILWINLVTDGLPALALASDPTTPNALKQTPRDPKEHILNKKRLTFIGILGIGATIVLLGVYALSLTAFPETVSRTILFNVLVFTHVGIAFFVRGQSLLRINPFLLATVILTIILQGIVTFTPLFQNVFELSLN